MIMVKMKNGFVNAAMIESFAIYEHEGYYDIVAHTPSYGEECCTYYLGKCKEEYNAYQRLEALAEYLSEYKSGVVDIMHLQEVDDA